MIKRKRFRTAQAVVNKLIERGWTISFAESCTGGMACARLVDVANASKVLNASFVTYANEAKEGLLGVSAKTLATYGAVSEETAREMAQGAAAAGCRATAGGAVREETRREGCRATTGDIVREETAQGETEASCRATAGGAVREETAREGCRA
ncbi:MAG: CinA family protein, partial [Clostridia bacterium]|nr:CinA family protein [Clostridia bacterium]